MSSIQTLSPGGVPQEGRSRFSSPLTTVLVVAHEGIHPMNMLPPPMVALVTLEENGYSRGKCPVSRFPWILICCKLFRFSTHNGNSPDSRLFSRCRSRRLESCPSSGGIDPVRLLPSSVIVVRLDRFPSWVGIDPVRLLSSSLIVVRLDKFPSWVGIDPVRLLLSRFSVVRLDRFPSWVGIDPVRLLKAISSVVRLDRFPSWVGIDPVRLLLVICSVVRLDRFPSWVGIDPVRLLLTIRRCVRLDRFPNSAGRLPFSSPGMTGIRFEVKLILVTRGGVPATVIPCQFDTAVVAFQLRVMVPRKVSFPAQRASQSATSPVFVVGLGTVVPFRHWVNVVCPETSNNNRPEARRSANRMAAAVAAITHRMGRLDEGG